MNENNQIEITSDSEKNSALEPEKATAEPQNTEPVVSETNVTAANSLAEDVADKVVAEPEENEASSTIFTKNKEEEKKPKKIVSGKKRRRNIIILLITACIVLAAAVFAVVKFLPNLNDEEEEIETPTIKVHTVTEKNMRKITVKTANRTLVLTGALEEKTTSNSTGSEETVQTIDWTLEGADDSLISESSLSSLSSAVSSLYATRQMTDTTLDYGLENPSITVEVEMQNAEENFTIYFGNLSPDESGYYAKVAGEENIYLVAAGTVDTINTTPEKLANTVIVSAPSIDDARSDEKIYFDEDEGTISSFDSIALSGSYYPNNILLTSISNDMAKYQITVGKKVRYANETNVTAMLGLLSDGLVAIDTYKLSPSKQDIKNYGLEKPDAVITLKYASKSVTVRAKLYDAEKNYYAVMVDGLDAVYAVTADALSMLEKREADFYNEFVFLEYLNDFTTVEINANNKNYNFDIAYDSEEETMTVTSNGAAVDDTLLSAYYQYLVTMSPTETEDTSASSTAAYTAKLKNKDGSKNFTIQLFKQSERRYLLKINGESYGVVSSTLYESLTTYIQYVMEGKGIPDAA